MGTDSQLTGIPDYNKLKIVRSGVTQVTAVAGSGQVDLITHNLGYIPMVLATAHSPNFPGQNRVMLTWIENPTSANYFVVAQVENVTSTSLQFGVTVGSLATGHEGVWDISYYLLQETAN
jgi:hypothetical protein